MIRRALLKIASLFGIVAACAGCGGAGAAVWDGPRVLKPPARREPTGEVVTVHELILALADAEKAAKDARDANGGEFPPGSRTAYRVAYRRYRMAIWVLGPIRFVAEDRGDAVKHGYAVYLAPAGSLIIRPAEHLPGATPSTDAEVDEADLAPDIPVPWQSPRITMMNPPQRR